MGQREHSRRLQIVKLAEKNKPFEETELGRIQIKLKHTLARRDEKRRVEQLKKREARAAQQGLVPGGQSQSQGGSVNPSVNIAAPATGTSGSGEGPGSRSGSRPPTRGKGQPEQEESGPQIPKNSRPAARVGTVGGTGSRDGSRNGSRSSSRMRSGSGQAFIGNDNPSKSNARGAPVKQTSLQELPLEAVEKTISKTEEEKKLVEESL